MLTSVIVPCWNALELTRVCLGQVLRWTTLPFELILIDNGSSDGTWQWLTAFRRSALSGRSAALKGVRLIRNRGNRGYPASMNQGIAASRGDFLVFGNNDAAVAPGWLEGMADALRASPRIGGVSPCTNPPLPLRARDPWAMRPWYGGIEGLEHFARLPLLRGRAPRFLAARGFIPGFWFLTRRSVIDDVGVFDERFFPGSFEDWDLQWRMLRAKYRLGFSGRVYVHHVGFACAARNGLNRKDLYAVNRKLLHGKHPGSSRLGIDLRTPPWATPPSSGDNTSGMLEFLQV